MRNLKEFGRKNFNLIMLIVGLSLAFGFLLGSASTKTNAALGEHSPQFQGRSFSLLRFIFGKTIQVPGIQEDGGFVFADFEDTKDLKTWKLISAKLELSRDHALEGSQSGKVTYYGGGELASIYIEDLVKSRKGLLDWSPYESLRFSI
ncbi:MAG: hypothetical protein HY351_05115, partial [Candidatus Omnitrophica bacterium]|nr:hypothetical protein [Candidatus Omnitrophota bacterium]